MATDADLAIVGSGFGGALLAAVASRIGLRVLLLERGSHPRFAIGESASPLAGVVLEQLARRYRLPRIAPLASFGVWRRRYPDVVCGLKRGFTYFKQRAGERYRTDPDRGNQLLVAASPCDEVADTHWLRADVDHFLVREAVAAGVEYLDRFELDGLAWTAAGLPVLAGRRAGRPLSLRVRAVVDASGPNGFLGRALPIAPSAFDGYPATQALFSHFTGVARCDEMPDYDVDAEPPYPIDDAALHHVFDGGWMWVLRFGNGVTSAGVAVIDAVAEELRLADGAPAWDRLLARYPSLAAQFAGARAIRPFTWMPRLAARASQAAGERWALLPSAAAFVDPLFSTGIPLTLLGVERLARVLEQGGLVGGASTSTPADEAWPAAYDRRTRAEAAHVARFVAGCYAAFPRFESFAAYAMFYFAAASYSELARRLAGGPIAHGFLGAASPGFAASLTALSPAAGGDAGARGCRLDDVAAAVAAWNVAGLCDPAKRNWYGVDLEDPVRHAARLGASPAQVRALLTALLAGADAPLAAVAERADVPQATGAAQAEAPIHGAPA